MELGSLLLSCCVALLAQEPAPAAPAAQEAPVGVEAELEKLEAAQSPEQVAAALDVLLAQHKDAKELARAGELLARRHTSLAAEKFLRAIATGSASKEARGFATFALAQLLLRFDSTLEHLANPKLDAKERETFVARRGAELVADLQKRDRAALGKEVEELLQTVADDYFLLDYAPTGYLGAAAEPQLYELKHLQVGMVAPEIEGEDEDGVPFALSDYRGKVVALDFWGFWCPICVRNLPSERETVEKHKDAPFSMLGVNSDPRSRLTEAKKYAAIPWRNFFDGGDAYGPIARAWNVRSWPVIYVLDENGVIRMKTEDAHAMAAKVDELLVAMQAQVAPATAPPADAPTPAEKYQAIQKEYQDANQRFSDLYEKAKSDEERRKLFESDYPDAKEYAQRFLALAAEAKGAPVALDCYVWVLQSAGEGELGARSYDALLADHLQSPKLLEAVATVGRYTPTIAAEKFARTIAEKSPHHDVQGQATYALSGVLLALASAYDTVLGPEAAPDARRTYAGYYGEETIADLETREPAEMRREAEDLLEDVAADFAKVKSRNGTLGEVADADLFELRNLQIGQVAPDILGTDLDGVAFKLSDYRGKVVVVDFWGFW